MSTRLSSSVAAQSAAKKRAVKSAKKTASVVVERTNYAKGREEGYCEGIRQCADAMLRQGESRGYIAETFCFADIRFPFTEDSVWKGMWAFDDWDDWVAVEESEIAA